MGVKRAVHAWTDKVLFKRVDPIGLAVFRMVFSLILACELFQLYTYRHIMYDRVPFGDVGELDVRYIFLFWGLTVTALFVGFKTRVSAVLNYIFSVIVFSSAGSFEYHIFYVYVGVGLVAVFLPLSATCSVDDWLARRRWALANTAPWPSKGVYAAAYLVPVLVGVGFVYFDSILYKFTSPMWLKGLGMWLPASLPMVIWNDASAVLDQKGLMLFLGYLVVAFETIFLFTFWHRRFRVPFLALGMFFHLGILIIFPIPWFALATMALYLLMVPVRWWHCLFGGRKREARVRVFYDASEPAIRRIIAALSYFDPRGRVAFLDVTDMNEVPQEFGQNPDGSKGMTAVNGSAVVGNGPDALCMVLKAMPLTWVIGHLVSWTALKRRLWSAISGSDVDRASAESPSSMRMPIELGPRGWRWFIAILLGIQLCVSLSSPLTQKTLAVLLGPRIAGYAAWPDHKLQEPFVNFTGITHHPVFMDTHFQGYEHIMKVEHVHADGTRTLVPLLDENGMTSDYVRGAFWVNYTFRVSGARVQLDHLERVRPYVEQYRRTRLADPDEGHYEIHLKGIQVPTDWERGFLHAQMEKPWRFVGEYHLHPVRNFIWQQDALEIESSDR